MNTIWKFQLKVTDEQTVEMPVGSTVLCVQTQRGAPAIWALVDPDAPKERRWFRIYGTGHEIDMQDECTSYVGTFQLDGGALVFHLFQEPR